MAPARDPWEHRAVALDPGNTPIPRALPAAPAALPAEAVANQRLPVDGGLAGLGLVTLAGAALGIVSAIGLFVTGRTFGFGGPAGGILPSLLIFALSLVRSGFHIGAGRAATKRQPILGDAVRRYVIVAAVHTLTVLGIVAFVWLDGMRGGTVPLVIGLGLFLMGWPVTLWVLVSRRSVKAIFNTADTFDVGLVPGDRSVCGAGVLMTVFGAAFLVLDLAAFAALVAAKVRIETSTIAGFVLLFLLAVRSVLHVSWGVAAMRGKMDLGRFRRVTEAYLWVAFATAILALGAMFAMEEFRIAFKKAPINIIYIAVVLVSALMAWPMVLRAFVQDTVPYWDAEADAERAFRPAVDRGLTTLGYLLVWLAVFGLSQWFLALLGVSLGPLKTMTLAGGFGQIVASLVVLGLQLWVALELLAMTPRRQLAALIYAGAALLAVALEQLVFRPANVDPYAAFDDGPTFLGVLQTAVAIALSLLLPIVTLVLSRTRSPAET